MPKTRTQWTEEETNLLLDNYSLMPIAELRQLLPTKTLIAIRHRAIKLGSKRTCPKTRVGNVERFLEDTPEALYWIGFMLADGHFNHSGRFQVNINDKETIEAFAKFINYSGTRQDIVHANAKHKLTYSITVYNKQVVNQIKQKYNIATIKTTTPPNLNLLNLSDDLLKSLIIGYIDGDGCIRSEGHCELQCHKTWLSEYVYFNTRLRNAKTAYLSKRDQAYLCLSVETMKTLKVFAITQNLPILKRKWDRVKDI